MSVNDIEKEKSNFEQLLKQLIGLLPSSYNKEVNDTNYYRLLRALALELSTAKIEVNQLKDDIYLNSVSPERLYDNFGTLVKLKKNPDWDDEKYRKLIQGVMSALLKGPTKESLIESFKLFTNLNVNVHELYKDADKVDKVLYQNYNPLFTFVFEVEKPLDMMTDQNALSRDSSYIVNIIKPAHTIGIIITTLIGEESFRKHYKEKNNIPDNVHEYTGMDVLDSQIPEGNTIEDKEYYDSQRNQVNLLPRDNIFGYRYHGAGLFTTMKSKTNSTDLTAPKYTLYDYIFSDIILSDSIDRYNMVYSQGSFEFSSQVLRSRLTWGSDTLLGEVRDVLEVTLENKETMKATLENFEDIYIEGSLYYEIFPEAEEYLVSEINYINEDVYDIVSTEGGFVLSGESILGSTDTISNINGFRDQYDATLDFREFYADLNLVSDALSFAVEDVESMYTPEEEMTFELHDAEQYLMATDPSVKQFELNESRLTDTLLNSEELGSDRNKEFLEDIRMDFKEQYNIVLKVTDECTME